MEFTNRKQKIDASVGGGDYFITMAKHVGQLAKKYRELKPFRDDLMHLSRHYRTVKK